MEFGSNSNLRLVTAASKITRGSGGTARWAFVELMLPDRTAWPTENYILLYLYFFRLRRQSQRTVILKRVWRDHYDGSTKNYQLYASCIFISSSSCLFVSFMFSLNCFYTMHIELGSFYFLLKRRLCTICITQICLFIYRRSIFNINNAALL